MLWGKTPFEDRNRDGEVWVKETGRDAAVAFVRTQIDYYDEIFTINHGRWRFWQTIIIVCGAIGTLASAVTIAPAWLPAWAQGLGWLRSVPVAITSIAAGFSGSYRYQSEAIRQSITADALRSELASFLAGAAPYDKAGGESVSELMGRARVILAAERGAWGAQSDSKSGSGA